MARNARLLLLALFLLILAPVQAVADDAPFETVVDGIVPTTKGLTITGATGGCDLLLQNQTGQDVLLFDLSKPPKPIRFAAGPKQPARPALNVHLAGAWPCASLPGVTEDERWNRQPSTVLIWSIRGQVGSLAFQLKAHTQYDPELDPTSQWMLYLRIGAGILALTGLVIAAPYLYQRRREILPRARRAA